MALPESVKDILAGTCGGVTQVLVGQPFDIVKVRIQTAPQGMYSGILGCISDIFKKGGLSAFYKGTELPLIGVGACVSIQFGVVQYVKRIFQDQNRGAFGGKSQHLSHTQLYLSGAAGGVANSVLASPIEQVRIRLQTQQTPIYSGPFNCMQQISAKGGMSGVFRGFVPTFLREGHGMGIYFLTYDYLVQQVMKRQHLEHRSQLSPTVPLLAGASAGIVLWMAVYPIDVVKSYMQTDAIDPKERRFRGMMDVVRFVQKSSGTAGFFRGIVPTLIRVCMSN
ncbi:hypothetical protein MPSI1_000950 [Malassezia psittaci]|uniref:Uncharacterized protein n=1 Tax=Malassezia psittaci TaxID=1821823 RepID=A0AAF0FCB2_9BASI|nr:hypothetical protein MPSI1_000950 [Malassezia psittaci]